VIAYLAADGLVDQLLEELALAGVSITASHGNLLLADGPVVRAAWAINVWHDAEEFTISSIGDAARILRGVQRNWSG
jgi:23S rRNA (cytidine2498-2'-O)-methyltransferase